MQDVKPLNYEAEKERFFQARLDGTKYNPNFTYRKASNTQYTADLQSLASKIETIENPVLNQYIALIERTCKWVEMFESKGAEFGSWLYSLYGEPAEEIVTYAYSVLDSDKTLIADKENQSAADAGLYFEDRLKSFGFSGWQVIHESMPAKIRINSIQKVIYVNIYASFSDRELQRLAVHEIGTHVVRRENGAKQPYEIFKFGFPKYLECEEGLAIFSEEKAGLLSDFEFGKYCLRTIACSLAKSSQFSEIFDILCRYTSSEHAYAITARVKRGLSDSGELYGYTKDQLYLSGYLKLKAMSKADVKRLYIGKIGFIELDNLDFKSLNEKDIYIPPWAQ